jgi:hypothetical protein
MQSHLIVHPIPLALPAAESERLAAGRNSRVVLVAGSVDTEAAGGERVPEGTLVGTGVAVRVRLDDCITSREERRVARLERKAIEHKVEENGVSTGASRRGLRTRVEPVRSDEGSVDVHESVGPDLADRVHLVLGCDGGVCVRVDGLGRRVGVRADASAVGDHVLAHHVVGDGSGGLLGPEGHGVGPALAHAAGLSGLEARASSTTGHAVGDTYGDNETCV